MAQPFKRYIITFLLLHLTFSLILVVGFRLFTDLTMEILAYLIWLNVIFGLLATLIQSVIFNFILSEVRLNKLSFFIIAFLVELALINCLVFYGQGDFFTGNLVSDIIHQTSRENLSVSLIFHISLISSTGIIALLRPVYIERNLSQ